MNELERQIRELKLRDPIDSMDQRVLSLLGDTRVETDCGFALGCRL